MQIIHVIPSYLPTTRYGGPILAVHGLCKALARLGHDVHVFTTNVEGAGETDVPLETPVLLDGVHVHYSRMQAQLVGWSPRLLLGLTRQLRPGSVLHVHSLFAFTSVGAARLARWRGVPYLVSPRGALVQRFFRERKRVAKTLWLRVLDAPILAGAARVHVTSESEQREIASFGLQLPPLLLLPNGVDLPPAELEHASRPAVRAPYALFLGRVSWVKGLDRAIEALAGGPVRLLVAGRDDEGLRPELEQRARAAGVAESVVFLGEVDGLEKWQLLRAARFLILPSYHENFGNVVAEAMAVGCPVIVTREVGAADVVRRAEAGLVVEGRPEALREAMQRLWARDEERARLGAAGARYVREWLSWDAVAGQFAETYAALVGAPR